MNRRVSRLLSIALAVAILLSLTPLPLLAQAPVPPTPVPVLTYPPTPNLPRFDYGPEPFGEWGRQITTIHFNLDYCYAVTVNAGSGSGTYQETYEFCPDFPLAIATVIAISNTPAIPDDIVVGTVWVSKGGRVIKILLATATAARNVVKAYDPDADAAALPRITVTPAEKVKIEDLVFVISSLNRDPNHNKNHDPCNDSGKKIIQALLDAAQNFNGDNNIQAAGIFHDSVLYRVILWKYVRGSGQNMRGNIAAFDARGWITAYGGKRLTELPNLPTDLRSSGFTQRNLTPTELRKAMRNLPPLDCN